MLSWTRGTYAAFHDVYFGTDFDDVNDAATASAQIYRGRQNATSYAVPETLVLNQIYFWKIDEFNDSNVLLASAENVWFCTIWISSVFIWSIPIASAERNAITKTVNRSTEPLSLILIFIQS